MQDLKKQLASYTTETIRENNFIGEANFSFQYGLKESKSLSTMVIIDFIKDEDVVNGGKIGRYV